MSLDIGSILQDWLYEPGQITVRKIRGDDGGEKIQLRLDLGVLQMETTGRPDGKRPHGRESLLVYYEQKLQDHKDTHGGDEAFKLDESACEQLRTEAVMYYHRYLAQFVLEDYVAVERDTSRNLRLLDFFNAYAAEESDRRAMEAYRPYMIMMNTRARGMLALHDNRARAALAIVKLGIDRIEDFYKQFGQEELISKAGETSVLSAFVKEIESRIPVDPLTKLKKDLAKAVREERYEDAAHLRDKLRDFSEDASAEAPDQDKQ
ncbi:MAG TPA: UvrB/UvrC motif-containing protein [Phycisphaerae bacterium]|nr:UvrB/UvrC motif-containing protein [Phycisphaerae bacterium]